MNEPTACGELIALRSGVEQVTTPDGEVNLVAWPHGESLGRLSEDQRTILKFLAYSPCAAEELADLAGVREEDAVPLIRQLRAGGWLATTLTLDGRRLCSLDPLRPTPPRPSPSPTTTTPVLSRFAVIRRRKGEVVVESPRAWCDLRIHDDAVLALLTGLGGGLPGAVADTLTRELLWAGFLCEDGSEESDFLHHQWSTHDLWFHERTRLGNRGTFWAKGRYDPPPARAEPFGGPTVSLFTPDLDRLKAADPSLTTILEDRQSDRLHDHEKPLTAEDLGEFLYRTCRTRWVFERDGFEYTSRPYPSGGAAYELEVYPVVTNVAGIDPGMYHYDSINHRLEFVAPPTHRAVRRMLRVAQNGMAAQSQPQVLLVISARVGRLMWKYEGMPYALILKHIGVLYQTMYCAATAMGLAACGLGNGDSSAFSEVTGLDPLVKCSLGELVLGSRHPDEPRRREVL